MEGYSSISSLSVGEANHAMYVALLEVDKCAAASKQANEYTMLCHARMRDTQHML